MNNIAINTNFKTVSASVLRSGNNKWIFTVVLSITLTLFFCSISALAQHDYRVSKRIAFKRGEISTVVKGTINNRLEAHEYIFRARQGQTVKIRLKSARKDMTFYLMDGEGNSMDEELELREWTGEVTDTGDHRLIISTKNNGSAIYTLEIQIASDI